METISLPIRGRRAAIGLKPTYEGWKHVQGTFSATINFEFEAYL